MTQPDSQAEPVVTNDQPTVIQEPGLLSVRRVPSATPRPEATDRPPPTLPGDGTAPLPLSRIGEYEILSTIGRGGMGVVFKARHVRLNRIVALKMLSGGLLARPDDVVRFENEAAAAAQLQHPNIVSLFEVGTFEGQPYFSMEYINGSSLAARTMLGPLPGRLAASYLERLARAVHYAHQRGIIHRDLKPANILLDENDQPKITDFGLAKVIRVESGQTRTGTVMGTPSYMAPEQANARKDIGPACDIYSLGAILYELVTGRPPFVGESALDTLRRVANDEPTLPRLINAQVDRDLETICLKCLEKEPARRYITAESLASDLRSYLDGEPIAARRLSVVRRTVKWVRRKPATAALLFVTLTALIGFGAFEWHTAEQEHQLREEAEQHRQKAEQQAKEVEAAHKDILAQQEISRYYLYLAQIGQVQRAWENADLPRALVVLQGWLPKSGHKDLRQWEWYFLRSLCQRPHAWQAHPERASSVAYRPDGKRLATAGGPVGKQGEVKIWDVATGKQVASLNLTLTKKPISALAFSPNGELLATAGRDHLVRIWDAATAQQLEVLKGHKEAVESVAFSRDGTLLASASTDGEIRVWEQAAPGKFKLRHVLKKHSGEVTGLAFHPKKNMLASSSTDQTVRLWDATDGTPMDTIPGQMGDVMCVAFDATGDRLVAGGGPGKRGGQLTIWSVPDKKELQVHDGLSERVLSVAVGKSGQIAAGCKDGHLYIWDQQKSTEPIRFRADTRPIYDLVFQPDGQRLASAGGSGQVRIWNSSGGTESRLLPAEPRTDSIAFGPKGRFLAAAGHSPDRDGEILLFDAASGVLKQVLKPEAGTVYAVAFSADEKWLAAGCEDQTIRLFNLSDGGAQRVLRGHQGRVKSLAFSTDGSFLASAAAEDEDVFLWDLETGKEKKRLSGHRIGVLALALSPNGRYLASGGYDKKVRIWDLHENTSRVLEGHAATIRALAFNPDSSLFASAGVDQKIMVWDSATGKSFFELEGTAGPVTGLAWHPRGRRLASVGTDRVVRLWDLITGREILQLHGPSAALQTVAFSPDGWQLAAAGDYPAIHVWDAQAGQL